ncbi:hypothetical protein A3Q56_08238 [Intoshia linei]|uniref:GRAM domain-containing protein n=1 Tax=Intoshia linei TaxID=1819745 RepID=A0A177APZ8_9BILA|nr:hypothetical protein A3Q56_08238 [Intoshia linei]
MSNLDWITDTITVIDESKWMVIRENLLFVLLRKESRLLGIKIISGDANLSFKKCSSVLMLKMNISGKYFILKIFDKFYSEKCINEAWEFLTITFLINEYTQEFNAKNALKICKKLERINFSHGKKHTSSSSSNNVIEESKEFNESKLLYLNEFKRYSRDDLISYHNCTLFVGKIPKYGILFLSSTYACFLANWPQSSKLVIPLAEIKKAYIRRF